jgi:hypothetical protein
MNIFSTYARHWTHRHLILLGCLFKLLKIWTLQRAPHGGENFDVIVEIITQAWVIFLDKETMKIWKKNSGQKTKIEQRPYF